MKIALLTDLHIPAEEEDSYGVDIRANFLRLLAAALQQGPDRLLVCGDLCFRDGDPAIYQWVRWHLDGAGLPYHLLSGNHDDTRLLADAFDCRDLLREGELYYRLDWDQWPVICLDSSSYQLSRRQLDWLREELAAIQGPMLLFIHHPPLPMGVPYMDEGHPLRNWPEVLQLLETHELPISVFCGHYHVEKSVRHRNLDVHVTPSCFFQIDWRQTAFAVDHHRVAFRWLELTSHGLRHALHYLEGSSLPAGAGS